MINIKLTDNCPWQIGQNLTDMDPSWIHIQALYRAAERYAFYSIIRQINDINTSKL